MNSMQQLLVWIKSMSLEESIIIIFAVFVFCEWITGRLSRLRTHNLNDSLRNLLTGIIAFLSDFLFMILTLPVWIYMFHHMRIFEFNQQGIGMFILLFILVDFSEYWFHRLSHEVNLLWTAHIVHHQSSFFNLTVGLRTSPFVPLFNMFFYSLFPLMGFDPENVILVIFIQGVYQLFIHTRLVGKLGILEYLIVTPSTHRVHHGKNEIYIDKNYGKFLILWDQVFGTYQCETEEVEYGITTPMEKNNVVHSVFSPFNNLIKAMAFTKNLRAWRILLFKNPSVAGKLQESVITKGKPWKGFPRRKILFMLVLCVFCSCSITKRKYRPGVYIRNQKHEVVAVHKPELVRSSILFNDTATAPMPEKSNLQNTAVVVEKNSIVNEKIKKDSCPTLSKQVFQTYKYNSKNKPARASPLPAKATVEINLPLFLGIGMCSVFVLSVVGLASLGKQRKKSALKLPGSNAKAEDIYFGCIGIVLSMIFFPPGVFFITRGWRKGWEYLVFVLLLVIWIAGLYLVYLWLYPLGWFYLAVLSWHIVDTIIFSNGIMQLFNMPIGD